MGFCRTEEVHYEGREKGLGQAGKNLGEMYHGAITLTDRHPLLISMHKKKKISGSSKGGKGSHLSFSLDAPGQEIPPAFEWRGR